jgi:predicted nucleic acid-binding protein
LAAFLVDTSALVKLYHPEAGSPFMERIFHDPVSNLLITRLTIVEIESAPAGKVRTGALDPQGAQIARRGFEPT